MIVWGKGINQVTEIGIVCWCVIKNDVFSGVKLGADEIKVRLLSPPFPLKARLDR